MVVERMAGEERETLEEDATWTKSKEFMRRCSVPTSLGQSCHFWPLYTSFSGAVLLVASFPLFYQDFGKLSVVIHHCFVSSMSFLMAVSFVLKKKIIVNLIKEMNTTFSYSRFSWENEVKQVLMNRRKSDSFAYKTLSFTFVSTVTGMAGTRVLHCSLTGETLALFPCRWPLDLANPFYYGLFLSWELAVIVAFTAVFWGAIALYCFLYSHIKTEYRILFLRIMELPECIERSSQDTGKPALFFINQCIRHHQQILRCFKKVQSVFAFTNLLLLSGGICNTSLAGLALNSENTILKAESFVVLTVQLTFLYIWCNISEAMAVASSRVGGVVYESDWTGLPKEAVSSLRILLERSSQPLYLTTLFGHKMSKELFMWMVKSSYSYFNMLIAMQNDT